MAKSELVFGKLGGGSTITQQIFSRINGSVTINIDNNKTYSVIGFNYGYSGIFKLIIEDGVLTEVENIAETSLGYTYANNVLTITGSAGWYSGYALTVFE